jgi:hypothetical protein
VGRISLPVGPVQTVELGCGETEAIKELFQQVDAGALDEVLVLTEHGST